MMWIAVAVLSAGVLALVGLLLVWSPGRPTPYAGEDGRPLAGSISEKLRVPINGVSQGMFIKGKDTRNPVLLFVHGGPGMPEYWLTQRYPTGLETLFTVCWWEQRGAGLSYRADIPPETMTAEQFISDTLEVTRYLRRRFGKKKIYLMGHSWGSYIGIQAAARAPDLYHAYIGVAQISHQIRSEKQAYDYMLKQFRTNGNARMVRILEKAPVTMTVPLPASYDAVRDEAMHRLGVGTTRDMKSVISGIFLPSWRFREYTLSEKVGLWRGKLFSRSRSFSLWDRMQATDLTRQATRLDIPVYLLHGVHDYTVSYTGARSYLERLDAPLKGFYSFERSAHSPVLEEPVRTLRIMREDVLAGANSLADGVAGGGADP